MEEIPVARELKVRQEMERRYDLRIVYFNVVSLHSIFHSTNL